MTKRMSLALLAFLPFVAFAAIFPVAFGSRAATDGEVLPVKSLVIDEFKSGAGTRFGKLEFLGGLVMATSKGELGAVSSIRLIPGGEAFISIMDTGHWAAGRIERDASGRLSGIADFRIHRMRDEANVRAGNHKDLDAEGLVLDGDRVHVSLERMHRILTFPHPGSETASPLATQAPETGGRPLRGNGGVEALLLAPEGSPLGKTLFFVAERSYDEAGNFIAGVQSGPRKGGFFVARHGAYDVTDGVVLQDGSFLLLERKFGLKDGIGMRIRRFQLADIKPGATIDGEVLMEADFSHQIDNMEGLDAFVAADGSTHLIVTSDDNHSLLERNLLLEFRIAE